VLSPVDYYQTGVELLEKQSRGWTDFDALGVEGVGKGEGYPLPSRLGGLGERRKLPQRDPGQSPGGKRIGCISALKYNIWWQQF